MLKKPVCVWRVDAGVALYDGGREAWEGGVEVRALSLGRVRSRVDQ